MRKINFTRKSKSIKEAMSYEIIPDTKNRRKQIPKVDWGAFAYYMAGQVPKKDTLDRLIDSYIDRQLRRLYTVYVLANGNIRRKHVR
jgi:hypothetical protein